MSEIDAVSRRSRPLFARVYQRLSRVCESHGVAEHRRELLAGLTGRVIEVGAGNGLNFAHYPEGVSEVVAVEPEPHLREAAVRAAEAVATRIQVVDATAEALPFDDGCFDAAVASLVLCSVRDQQRALHELFRVIHADGQLRFYEHVRSTEPRLARIQGALDLVWPRVSGGCHMSRDTLAAVEAAGFEVETLRRFRFPEAMLCAPTSPHILGIARSRAGDGPRAVPSR